MHINKFPFLEKFMDGIRRQGTNAENRLEGIRSRTQMGYRTQVFKAVALLLKRIIRRGSSFHKNLLSLHFDRLLCPGCLYNRTRRHHRSSHADSGCFRKPRHFAAVYDLKRLKKGSVINYKESKILGIPVASHPSANGDLPALILFFFSE